MAISPPDKIAETVPIPETVTSPVKTMTVLQSARPGADVDETTTESMEGATKELVNPVGSFGSS